MSQRARWAEQLTGGLGQMNIHLTVGQQDALLDYLSLLRKWNRTYNLTAIRDPEQMVPRQILDSLSILHLLWGKRILDVGTGPGLPGIPLAIASSESRFTLLDSNGKKTRFLQQAEWELGLKNLEIVRSRVEEFHPGSRFDTLTSRAFSGLEEMAALTSHLVSQDGCLLAMKGEIPLKELETMRKNGFDLEVIHLNVPWTAGRRHAIVCRPASRKP